MNTVNTHSKSVDETKTIIVGLGDKLYGDELLTGTPTVEEIGTGSTLTFSDAALTSADQEIVGRVVKANQGVQFTVSGGTAGVTYRIRVTATTDADEPQTITANFPLLVYA